MELLLQGSSTEESSAVVLDGFQFASLPPLPDRQFLGHAGGLGQIRQDDPITNDIDPVPSTQFWSIGTDLRISALIL
jgi:hypothetical protein